MLHDSFFLTNSGGKSWAFQQFGCCQSIGDSLLGKNICEFIKISEIGNEFLENKEIIKEYISLVSEFMNIPIEHISIPQDIVGLPDNVSNLKRDELEDKYITFKVGGYLSNKHLVATHNLIRYLWYNHEGYHSIVNATISIRRELPTLAIEDVFAIAHSFQEKTNRALTGKRNADKFGFIYFKDKSEYLSELKININFNTVFDNKEIVVVPKITIKGTFFEDSEMVIDTKQFTSFLTFFDDHKNDSSNRVLREVIETYLNYKPLYKEVSSFINKKFGNNYIMRKFDIYCDVNNLDYIDCDIASQIGASNITKKFKSIKEVSDFIKNFK